MPVSPEVWFKLKKIRARGNGEDGTGRDGTFGALSNEIESYVRGECVCLVYQGSTYG